MKAFVRPALLVSLAPLALLWFLLFYRLHTEWTVNTLYSYGWAVPALALYLFSERWRDRPTPAAKPLPLIWLILPGLLLLAYFPVRIINEANPDWVKINAFLVWIVWIYSFATLFAIGRFRYVWHFAFPILFTWTAMPWPVWMEENLVQTLTRWNTDFSAEVLTLVGHPAIAHGNVIEIGGSKVNVEEACSGIRSLQTSFMMSLFLGEFYRLPVLLRVLLMLSSFAVAFVLNIGRTMFLTYLSGAHGPESLEKWHDHVGTAVMICCLAGLWFLALGFEKWKKRLDGEISPAAPAATAQAPVLIPYPAAFAFIGVFVLVGAEVATEWWYRSHEAKLPPVAQWKVQWPESAQAFRRGEFPDRTRAILKYNEADTCSWLTPEGHGFQMYHIRWHPGRVSKFLSGAHYPTVCLPASGLVLKAETGRFRCRVGNLEIPFATFLFSSGNQNVYVFHAILEDQPAPDGEKIEYRQVTTEERYASVWRGHRNLGQQVLGISVVGPYTADEAEDTVRRTLNEIVKTTPPKIADR